MPMKASMNSDHGPICLSGLIVRWPRSAAVPSPCSSAIQACMNSWAQTENTTMMIAARKNIGSFHR